MTITKNRAGNGRGNSGAGDASLGSMKGNFNPKVRRGFKTTGATAKIKQLEETIKQQETTIVERDATIVEQEAIIAELLSVALAERKNLLKKK
jgi:uncharacterized coiled-coil protein SlyX